MPSPSSDQPPPTSSLSRASPLLGPLAAAALAILLALLLKRPTLLTSLRTPPSHQQPPTATRHYSIYNLLVSAHTSLHPPNAYTHPQSPEEKSRTEELLQRLGTGQRVSRERVIAQLDIPLPLASPSSSPLKTIFTRSGIWSPPFASNQQHPRERLMQVLFALENYEARTLAGLEKKRKMFRKLPHSDKKLLEMVGVGYVDGKIAEAEKRVRWNAQLCRKVKRHAMVYYGIGEREVQAWRRYLGTQGGGGWGGKGGGGKGGGDHTSLTQALKHFVRDYAGEGERERRVTFGRVMGSLEVLFPSRKRMQEVEREEEENGGKVKVLIPGSGVGGLMWQVAKRGEFEVTGVEWSFYMNVLQHYIASAPQHPKGDNKEEVVGEGAGIESGKREDQHLLYPYLEWWSHHATTQDMLRGAPFPESWDGMGLPRPLTPTSPELPPDHEHSYSHHLNHVFLLEEDFLGISNSSPPFHQSAPQHHPPYHAITTLFFIDTAQNLLSYITTIHSLLSPGGWWINLGPLLYGTAPWVELSLEEVVKVAEGVGFEFVRLVGESVEREGWDKQVIEGLRRVWVGERSVVGRDGKEEGAVVDTLGDGKVVGVKAGYTVDWRGLGRNEYMAQGWVARKRK